MFCKSSKTERIDYARRLERIESLKAKGRMSDGGKGKENFPDLKGQTRDTVEFNLCQRVLGNTNPVRLGRIGMVLNMVVIENQTLIITV